MRLLSLIAIIFSLLLGPALADGHGVVNVYSARHYDSDVQLYEKFTAKTGIKVNVVSGKSGALEKRIIEEGGTSEGSGGERPEGSGVYYSYIRDLDGNKICAFTNNK